ncbi:MAG: mechanosensitive ion channel family protein [Limnospira sp.]
MKKIARLIGIALLAFCLTLTWESDAVAQFPFLPAAPNIENPETPWWDLNRAEICGSHWCSHVYLSGNLLKYKGDLTLGAARELGPDEREIAVSLERRAKLLEESFNRGVRNIARAQSLPQVSEQKNWQFWLPYNSEKPLHPLTPRLEIGTENKETVIFAPAQLDFGIPKVTFVTVTRPDATVNATTVQGLAVAWQDAIRQSASEALWGREFDAQYPWARLQIALGIGGMGIIGIWVLSQLRKFLRRWRQRVKRKLEALIESAQFNPETASGETLPKSDGEVDFFASETESDPPLSTQNIKGKFDFGFKQKIAEVPKAIAARLNSQTSLQQEKNLVELLRRFIFVGDLFIVLICIGLIFFIFRQTRPFMILVAVQAIAIPALWIGITVIDKIFDFAIDSSLNSWAIEQQEADPKSNRYTMRASTYSPALKSGKTVIMVVLGLYGTIVLLGINPAILAGAGALALLTAFLSRNIVENMLNGILILSTDRYVVGDVVQIGQYAGAVESMNLYVTNLRNLDGQSIAIPNGQISAVINNTKDWSRVNFGLQISWDADIRKTMEIIREVSQKMQGEPEWKDKILEPLEILGVDDISHEGTVIRFLIKTLPSQQWAVGRTLRLRLKTALDEAGIALGVPQRSIWYYQDSGYSPKLPERSDSEDNPDKNTESEVTPS